MIRIDNVCAHKLVFVELWLLNSHRNLSFFIQFWLWSVLWDTIHVCKSHMRICGVFVCVYVLCCSVHLTVCVWVVDHWINLECKNSWITKNWIFQSTVTALDSRCKSMNNLYATRRIHTGNRYNDHSSYVTTTIKICFYFNGLKSHAIRTTNYTTALNRIYKYVMGL